MKKINFLTKLRTKGLIELVEPSEELKQSHTKKSESNLDSAKILLNNDKLEESIALTYYSMYNLLLALLFKTGIKSENHAASIIILKEIFNLENREISKAKEERIDAQYYADFQITKDKIKEAIINAENFNSSLLDFISKLTNEDINKYRDIFIEST